MHFHLTLTSVSAALGPDWGSIADWVVAITALVGVAFGVVQLLRITQANRAQVGIARAELMLEIDDRFESEHMLHSRIKIQTLRNYSERKARNDHPNVANAEMLKRASEIFSKEITALYNRWKTPDREIPQDIAIVDLPDDPDGPIYFMLMRLPYWMETVGQLTRTELLPLDDVLDLYDAVFIGILTCFEQHIDYRRTAAPLRNDKFLENAMWIREKAIEREARLAQAAERAREPRKTGIF